MRLFFNLFFIIAIAFTLSVLPVNINSFTNAENLEVEKEEVQEPIQEGFKASYSIDTDIKEDNINPSIYNISLQTNIDKENLNSFNMDDLKLVLYKNDIEYKTINYSDFVIDKQIIGENNIRIDYKINVASDYLKLDNLGYYKAVISFDKEIEPIECELSYLPAIHYIGTEPVGNEKGNFVYKVFYKDFNNENLVPVYYSVKYPKSITLEVKSRLATIPDSKYGLSESKILPDRTNLSKLGKKHYGVYLKSAELTKIVKNKKDAMLMINSIVDSFTRLPHIEKISFFVDDKQDPALIYGIDITKPFEKNKSLKVYLSKTNNTMNRYLIPINFNGENIFNDINTIFNILKSGNIDNKQYIETVPKKVLMNNFVIEGTTITVDFNKEFLTAFTDDHYNKMMIDSIIYSFTSSENINKIKITVENEPLIKYGYDFTEPVKPTPYINYLK